VQVGHGGRKSGPDGGCEASALAHCERRMGIETRTTSLESVEEKIFGIE